jgi:NhaP-type Na+/H+ and K+/H+ antiporter
MNVKKFGFWEWWCVVWATYDVVFAVIALVHGNIGNVIFNASFAVLMVALLFWNIHIRKMREKSDAEWNARMAEIFGNGVQDR